jgi:hypothetical protein
MLVAPSAAPLSNSSYAGPSPSVRPEPVEGAGLRPETSTNGWSPAPSAPAVPAPRPAATGWGEAAPARPEPAVSARPEAQPGNPLNAFAPTARPPIAPPVSSWGAPPPPAAPAQPVPPPVAAAPAAAEMLRFENIEALELTPKTYTDEEAIACSLENPESCEACQ